MIPRSVEHLVAATEAGESFEYLLFWGHHPSREVTRRCLSNWWPSTFELDGHEWTTVEHFMMHAKAALFGDEIRMQRIRNADTPKDAKTLGRQVTPYGDESWAAHRYYEVRRALVAKFEQNAELGDFLRATGDKVLVEASPHDRIWGIGLKAEDPEAKSPATWRGANLLGFALMDVRQKL